MGASFSFQDRIDRQTERLAKATDPEVRQELEELLKFIRSSGKSLRIRDGFKDWNQIHTSSDQHMIQGRSLAKLRFPPECTLRERLLLAFELAGCMRPSDF